MLQDHLEFGNGLVWLDEPKAVYYSGQLISGKVNFELNNPLKLLHINVDFNGEANVEWSEKEYETYNGVKTKKYVKYVAKETYFNFTQCVCGGNGVTVLPTGAHSLPFVYQLPPNIPSTFQGEKGQVLYKITASVLHADGVTKQEVVKNITVVAPLDLNTEENKEPIQMEFEEILSCNWSCQSRPLCILIRTPHSGYSPGEVIPITVDARNESNVEVSKIIFEVIKRTRYLSQQPISSVIPPEEVVVSMKRGPILSNTTKQYVFDLKLPDFIALNLDDCGIIDAGYFLKVKMKVSGCNDDMSDEASLCLGLEPIGSTLDVKATHPMADSLPISPIPKPTSTNPPFNPSTATATSALPPPYDSVLSSNLQICPPGPYPYPTVVDTSMHGLKTNIVGAFETHAPKSMQTPPVPEFQPQPYPNPEVSGQHIYHAYPQPYPNIQNVPYPASPGMPNHQFPNLPPDQRSVAPSAPPPS